MAPSTKDSAQPSPMTACATAATANIVARTTPTASSAMGRALARRSRSEVKKAAP